MGGFHLSNMGDAPPRGLARSAATVAISLLDKAFSYLGVITPEFADELSQHLRDIEEGTYRDLWSFRDIVEEVEDAIDDIEYKELEVEARNPISRFVKTNIVNKVARFVVPNSDLQRLRKAIWRLFHGAFRVKYSLYLKRNSSSRQATKEEVSGSLKNKIKDEVVFGRDREKEQIVQWLTQEPQVASTSPILIFAIVGMAGMGKTTLAQVVRADPRVSVNFDCIVWLPQAADLRAEAITAEILRSVNVAAHSRIKIMKNIVLEKFRKRKVLLILDDVWEDDNIEKWEDLVSLLRSAKRGSKIMLTTRMQSVADMAADIVGIEAECLNLGELDEHSNFLLFKSQLPRHINSEDHADFLFIGEQIAQKIGGCPILTSAIASQLGENLVASYWHTVLQGDMHQMRGKQSYAEFHKLSYDRLPTQLQVCFRYCAIFPRGHKFNKEELVNMWVGSGLIPFNSSKQGDIGLQTKESDCLRNPEDIGQQCFAALTRKSFFCRILEKSPPNGDQKEYYVLHSLMHDLAQFVSRGECARVDNGDFRNVMRTTRHLYIAHCSNITEHIIREINSPKRLRTLIIQSKFCLDQQAEVLFGQVLGSLKCLRLLYLDVPSLSHALVRVSSLTHLRYLFLFSSDGYHLRGAFKLYHLQVFKLSYLTAKKADFSGIYNLRSLHCLHVPDTMLSNIHHIGRLTSLRELHGFEVMENDGHRLSALSNLTSLHQLSLRNLQNVRNCEEAVKVKLKDKQHLRFLSLSWNKYLKDPDTLDPRIIDSLEPNKEIQQLHINGYNGVLLPLWIEKSLPIHLVSLELEYCMKWKTLPSLQELNSLKYLKLEHLFQLEYIGTGPEEQFGTKESEISPLPPFLNTLIVRWCPNLKKLPAIPCTLKQLMIKHVGLEVLPGMHQRYTERWESSSSSSSVKSNLAFLHIESCAHLTSLGEGLLKQQEHLKSLATLVVRYCERLRHLPAKGFTELHHLDILEIVACPMLRDATTEGSLLPMLLTNLDINPCGDIEVSILVSVQNLTFLTRLTLLNCSNLEILPSEKVFGTLKNLNDMSIARCKNLLSLGGLGAVASLRVLSILCCDNLHLSQEVGCSFKLQKLEIDRQAMLLVEPIKSLGYAQELHICDDYAMESLPGEWLLQNATSLQSIQIGVAESLRSLPSQMINLQLLQSLHIERAPLIQSLPQMPMSLRKLTIWGCDTMFLKRYEEDVGPDWSRIAHIADVDMKACSEGMNYSGDEIQDFNNGTSNPCRRFVVME